MPPSKDNHTNPKKPQITAGVVKMEVLKPKDKLNRQLIQLEMNTVP